MSRRLGTVPGTYFDRLYRTCADPWRFETSAYERDKYAATLSVLTRARYGRALECGCSIGVFTSLLAPRCDKLIAVDASETALNQASRREGLGNVSFERRMLPAAFPEGRFDLIVLSEVLYFLAPDDLKALARQCSQALAEDGEMVLCHWLGETDYPLTGLDASNLFAEAVRPRFANRAIVHDATYRLEHIAA